MVGASWRQSCRAFTYFWSCQSGVWKEENRTYKETSRNQNLIDMNCMENCMALSFM
eukprot:m.309647 g.309647  ORF g.309647 m.309647 type:complete len:56 (+) comp47184_c0_seq1:928-1095(+)